MYFGASMRAYLSILFLAFFTLSGSAQDLYIQQEGGKLFLGHKVAAKENWYSIGRMYNVSPKEMAPFNNTPLDKGLSIGQQIKVPLTSANFSQSGQPAVDEVFVPLYHKVKEKEGLYRISQMYNKVSPDLLKSWNKLKTDEISVGSQLVVGYLRVKQNLSPLANEGQLRIKDAPVAKQTKTEPIKENQPAKQGNAPATGKETTAANKEVNTPTTGNPSNPPESNPPTSNTSVPNNSTVQTTPGNEGVFAALYNEQTKGHSGNKLNGQGAVFKSTSGWKDGKYYVLMNKVTPNTIIKVTLLSTKKVVYAKVLGEIPPGTQNDGLLIRLSSAASAQLQAPPEGRFDILLEY